MNQVTVTIDLTPRNLELLRMLCEEQPKLHIENSFPFPASPFPEEPVQDEEIKGFGQMEFPEVAEEKPEPKPEPVQAQDVKAVCLKLSKSGRSDELRRAFAKFGGKKFSDIRPEDYAALLKELGDG